MKTGLGQNRRPYEEGAREADEETARQSGKRRRKSPQADLLVELAKDGVFVHDANGDVYVRFEVAGHHETHPVRSKAFRRRLTKAFLDAEGKAPNRQALETAICTIEAIAHFESPEEQVFIRVGRHEDAIYLDLGDRDWRGGGIKTTRWGGLGECPLSFRRGPGGRALVEPARALPEPQPP